MISQFELLNKANKNIIIYNKSTSYNSFLNKKTNFKLINLNIEFFFYLYLYLF